MYWFCCYCRRNQCTSQSYTNRNRWTSINQTSLKKQNASPLILLISSFLISFEQCLVGQKCPKQVFHFPTFSYIMRSHSHLQLQLQLNFQFWWFLELCFKFNHITVVLTWKRWLCMSWSLCLFLSVLPLHVFIVHAASLTTKYQVWNLVLWISACISWYNGKIKSITEMRGVT